MRKSIYLRLALANVRRSREVYGPYFLAATIMSCVYFLILALLFSKSVQNVPGGETAMAMFGAGTVVFTLFAFGFLIYINAFLTKRRKKEFGLYSVLGMNRRHVARVLRWEMLIVVGVGLVAGILLGMVFGRLTFLLLLKVMRAAAAGSTFTLPPIAFLGTTVLFAAVLVANNIYNSARIHMVNTAELLQSDKRGEKDSKLVLPAAILGLVLLGGAYAFALLNEEPAMAMVLFFPAAFVVIIATFLLFFAGSIALLRLLRKNKTLYYKSSNFVAISGMFHRMRVNARGLASICIFSTMLLVTVAGASSLYFGQEQIARVQNPYDLSFQLPRHADGSPLEGDDKALALAETDARLAALAAEHGVTLSAVMDERLALSATSALQMGVVTYTEASPPLQLNNAINVGNRLCLDIKGSSADAEAFIAALNASESVVQIHSIYETRRDGYGMYGGLLFLAAFFAILFLVMMVLMIYFKQITEGGEDQERFAIMQKVGMQDTDVKQVINRQILWVFFLPLGLAVCHMLAASKMMTQMISLFGMLEYSVTLRCIGITSVVFALVYLFVYRQTAKVYYRIVKW